MSNDKKSPVIDAAQVKWNSLSDEEKLFYLERSKEQSSERGESTMDINDIDTNESETNYQNILDAIKWGGISDEEKDHLITRMLRQKAGTLLRATSETLRQNLGFQVAKEYQVHHLICVSTVDDTKEENQGYLSIMQKASSIGYDINNRNNLIALPPYNLIAELTGTIKHWGGHTAEYYAKVREYLTDLNRAAESGKNWGNEELLRRIQQVEDKIRHGLLNKEIILYDKDMPISDKDISTIKSSSSGIPSSVSSPQYQASLSGKIPSRRKAKRSSTK